MKFQSQKFRITGLTPLLMHCGQTADPLNPFAKLLKRLSDLAKKNKTDEAIERLGQAEWWAGLYLDIPPVIDGETILANPGTKVVIPAHVLDSALRDGARVCRNGKQICAGCLLDGDGTFKYEGPKDLTTLVGNPEFHYRVAVRVGQAKVIRSRPMFKSWSCEFSLTYDADVVKLDTIAQAWADAGRMTGIGDWRPGAPRGGSWGRFEAQAI